MSWIPTRTSTSSEYNRLFATCMARLPGIGVDNLAVELGNAMQEFCRETAAWREKMERNTVAGMDRYSLSPSANAAIVTHVISVEVDGRHYRPLSPEMLGARAWSAYEVLDNYQEIKLYPVPEFTTPKALKASVALTLRTDSLDLPNELLAAYYEPLLDGALERAFAHHAKPYSNSEKAAYHHRRFRAAITRTRRIVRGGDAQAGPPWHFHTQAPGTTKRGGRTYGW